MFKQGPDRHLAFLLGAKEFLPFVPLTIARKSLSMWLLTATRWRIAWIPPHICASAQHRNPRSTASCVPKLTMEGNTDLSKTETLRAFEPAFLADFPTESPSKETMDFPTRIQWGLSGGPLTGMRMDINIPWHLLVWRKIKQEGQTAGFGPCFHLPGLHFGIPVF